MSLYRFLIFIILPFALITSCNNDDDNDVGTCTQLGLFYTIDVNPEVYLPQGGNSLSHTTVTQNMSNPGDVILVHELGNGFLLQSSATALNENSNYNSDVSNTEGTQLIITNVLSNPDSVDINFICLVNDGVVGGVIRYSFSGTFTENGINHTISGQVCAVIDTVN